jgi:hypothetical protein
MSISLGFGLITCPRYSASKASLVLQRSVLAGEDGRG